VYYWFKKAQKAKLFIFLHQMKFFAKKGIYCCIDEDGETIKDIIQKEIYLEN
jgi:hypothetical protein